MASSEIIDWDPKIVGPRTLRDRNGRSVILRRRFRAVQQPVRHGKNRRAIHDAANVFLRMSNPPTQPVSSTCRARAACRDSRVSCDSFEQPLQSPIHDNASTLSFNSSFAGHRDRPVISFRRAALSMQQTVESSAPPHSPRSRIPCMPPPSRAWRQAA